MKLSLLLFFLSFGPCLSVHVCAVFFKHAQTCISLSCHLVLNVEQFQRFMSVIKRLGDRVQKEHDQFLRDAQRIDDRSATAANSTAGPLSYAGNVDFESLVGGANGALIKSDTATSGNDDVWSSIFNNDDVCPIHY